MAMPEPLRVAVVGCGPIGTLHAEAVGRSSAARLVGVCDVDRGRAESLSRRFRSDVSIHDRLAVLLAGGGVDVVTIATPDHLHVGPALEALTAGCHVFCEKPLATTSAGARQLVEAARTHGVQLGVDYNRRFGFGYQSARGLLDAGRLGALGQLVFHVMDRTPRPEVARVPTVILTTLLTHHLDLARWFGGEVTAIRARFGPPDPAANGLRRDVVLNLELASGALGVIVAGYRDGLSRTVERAELSGSLGTASVRDVTRRADLWTTDPDHREVWEPSVFGGETGFYSTVGRHMEAFLACLAAGDPVPVSGEDGLRGLELAEAALRSHEEGRTVATERPPSSIPG